MKKKVLALLLMTTLAVSVTACGRIASNIRDYDDMESDFDEDEEFADTDEEYEEEIAESEGTLVFDVPEGFSYDAESMQYLSTTAGEIANINYLTNPNDGSFHTTTADMMEEALESTLSGVYGESIDLTMTQWDYIEVAGYEAVQYQVEYLYSGYEVIQMQVIVDGVDNLHFVTFTYLEQEGYADAFEACVDSFRFE